MITDMSLIPKSEEITCRHLMHEFAKAEILQ